MVFPLLNYVILRRAKADKGNILGLRLEENVPMWGKNESHVRRISIDTLLLSIHLTTSRPWANGVFRITGFCFKCPSLFPYCTDRGKSHQRKDVKLDRGHPGGFSIGGDDGSENVNSHFFKLRRVWSNSLKMSNAGKFPWS